jgi:ElaB/YqjD/DUF883 family membrane-anchored ribosome-binding protein
MTTQTNDYALRLKTDSSNPSSVEATDETSDTDKLRREVEETRAEIDETISELKLASTPNALMEDAWDLVRSLSTDAARGIGRTAQQHPVPSLLIGAGAIWLVASMRRKAAPHDYDPRWARTDEDVLADIERIADRHLHNDEHSEYEMMGDVTPVYGAPSTVELPDDGHEGSETLRERASHTASAAAERVKQGAARVKEGASSAATGAKRGVQKVAERVKSSARVAAQRSGTVRSRLAERTSSVRQTAGQATTRVRTGVVRASQYSRDQIEAHPLILGAIGIGLGAALGGLLPRTERENQAIGPTADRVKLRMKEEARRRAESLRDAVRNTASDARSYQEQYKQQAVSGARDTLSNVEQRVESAGNKVKDRIGDAIHRAKEAAVEQIRQAQPDSNAGVDPGSLHTSR